MMNHDLGISTVIAPLSLKTTEQIVRAHGALVNDFNPLHFDAAFAAGTSFGAPIIHGSLMLNLLTEAIERTDPALIANGRLELRFMAPARVGETITASGEASERTPETFDVRVTRDDGTEVLSGVFTPGAG